MPRTNVVFYREDDGSVPLLEWIARLPAKAKAKCRVRIHRLRAEGHELRRPEADYLRDGIPPSEIDAAIERRRKFVADPPKHTYEES
jgi:hypothetical protein